MELHRTRPRTLVELAAAVKPYFVDTLQYENGITKEFAGQSDLPSLLGALKGKFAQAQPWDKDALEKALRELAEEKGVKAGALIHPVRMAVTASKVGSRSLRRARGDGEGSHLQAPQRVHGGVAR